MTIVYFHTSPYSFKEMFFIVLVLIGIGHLNRHTHSESLYQAQVSSFCRGCGVPRVPEDGTVNAPGTEPGDIITITCNEGFKQYRGSRERTCLVYGSWSGEEPECRRMFVHFTGCFHTSDFLCKNCRFEDL